MATQYKPTKAQKVKPGKAPKAPKAEKAVKFSSAAQSVKFDKPKKVKEPKAPKAPKPEKAVTFKPGKVEKVSDVKASGRLRQPVRPAVVIIALVVVIAVVAVAAVAVFGPGRGNETASDFKQMEIVSMPVKTQYYVGEEPSYYGLQVKLTLESGASCVLEAKHCEISGFDSSAPAASQTITVTYDGLRAKFDVTILEKPVQDESSAPSTSTAPSGKFNGLSFKTLPKTQYKVGERLDVTGGVLLRHYDDGTTKEIELEYSHVVGFDSLKPGTYTLTVQYIERGFLATCEYTITVTE